MDTSLKMYSNSNISKTRKQWGERGEGKNKRYLHTLNKPGEKTAHLCL